MRENSENNKMTVILINQLYNLYDLDDKNCDFTRLIKSILIGKLLSEIRSA